MGKIVGALVVGGCVIEAKLRAPSLFWRAPGRPDVTVLLRETPEPYPHSIPLPPLLPTYSPLTANSAAACYSNYLHGPASSVAPCAGQMIRSVI